ncbi:MAG: Hpt domain-containing protein [Deltaproteobacteria bacterium]|nr:Hpt domain-containing protein [Deltaproteobacteria bacterium]MCB9788860.1 Hpt domain-containing protein [Deltaproteobacteria bacterium]
MQDDHTQSMAERSAVVPTGPQRGTGPEPQQAGPLRVLVAQGERADQAATLELLERRGHNSHLAANGRAALAALMIRRFDVVLVDLDLPDLDACDLAGAVRDNLPLAARPALVALGASSGPPDRGAALRDAGIAACIARPVRADELFPILARVAAARAAEHAAAGDTVDLDIFARFRAGLGADEGAEAIVDDCIAAVEHGVARLAEAVGAGDAETAARACHDLKSTALMLGAVSLSEQARALERSYREGRSPAVDLAALAASSADACQQMRRASAR